MRYSLAIERGLGVCLEAFGSTSDAVVAKIFVPKDEDTRQRSLMPRGGLKLAAAVKMLPVRPVTNFLMWFVLLSRFRESTRAFLDSFEFFSEA